MFRRQVGSHQIFTSDDSHLTISVPVRRELPAGTLRRIIRDAGVDVDTFVKASRG
ncbi:MAG: type II toxin-antitoxin system HicA family toxin [Methanoregulaceae archaeon]|nr:type II toxin-antitoxin system HicA family toxin [Methanoregulaceae archaeon]